jgi:hypothetical protein
MSGIEISGHGREAGKCPLFTQSRHQRELGVAMAKLGFGHYNGLI